jgi:hypothetical protein
MKKVPSVQAAKIISVPLKTNVLLKLKNVYVITLRIDEKLNDKIVERPKTSDMMNPRPLLISYESSIDESEKIIFWKNTLVDCFLETRIDSSHSGEFSAFVKDFLIENLESLNPGEKRSFFNELLS